MATSPRSPSVGGDAALAASYGRGLTFPEEPPAPGRAVELADGVLWFRLPMPGRLEHVNAYALDDGPGWTLVDTGPDTEAAAEAWDRILAGPLRRRPILRVILTHHHADHTGRVAALAAQGATIWASRAAWLTLRMQAHEPPAEIAALRAAFLRRLGMATDMIPACLEASAKNDRLTAAPPPSYRRLVEGEVIELAGRAWRLRLSDGHAAEHASLWSEDGTLAIVADQGLPSISANLGTDPREPEGNTIDSWLGSVARLGRFADDRRLALPGHERPYRGLAFRLQQMAANHSAVLDRIRAALGAGPICACDAVSLLHDGAAEPAAIALAASEVHAYLLYLLRRGEAVAAVDNQGVARFHAPARQLGA